MARRAAEAYAALEGTVVAAFVSGSIAHGDVSHWGDVDLRIVADADATPTTEFILDDGVPIEWGFLPLSHFADLDAVRRHPFHALEVAHGAIVHDPSGWLARIQDELCDVALRDELAPARASALLWHAASLLRETDAAWREHGAVSLWDVRSVLFWAVEAVHLFAGRHPTHRRALSVLREAADHLGAPGLHLGALDLFGARTWSPTDASDAWRATRAMLQALPSAINDTHHYLARDRLAVWDEGIERMSSACEHRETSLPIFTLAALAWTVSQDAPDARASCGNLLSRLGWDRPHGVAARFDALRAWFARVVELVGLPDSPAPPSVLTSLDDALLIGRLRGEHYSSQGAVSRAGSR